MGVRMLKNIITGRGSEKAMAQKKKKHCDCLVEKLKQDVLGSFKAIFRILLV
jgi:hypothetical protein